MATIRGSHTFVWDTSRALGQGATSMVYMGRNKKTGDEVAVKVFNHQSFLRPDSVQQREFEVMTKLSHENIVKLLAIEEELPNRHKVIVMEFCTHGTLYNLLEMPENNFGLAEDEFLRVLYQVTEGMRHLRDNNIIHRDIKPGNILRSVMEDGRSVFKLTDFGAARELEQDEEFMSLYGTDEYLHPAMFERAVLRRTKGQHFGAYVDLWSLGVTIYHAAAGNLPFRPYGGRRNKDTMYKITSKKEQGVISGVQETEGGPIKWSRDLPSTCKLTRGLKSLMTPFLAALLESECRLSFDDYFVRVEDIKCRRAYSAFCPSACALLTLYARPRDDMSQLRQLITDQTDIPGGAQMLMLEGRILEDESRQPVCNFLSHVTRENPIFVFNKLPEFRHYIRPQVERFQEIPPETNVNQDYPLSKKCIGVLHAARNAVRTILHTNKLLSLAVKMYSNQIRHQCTSMELSMGHVNRACGDTRAWKDQVFLSLGLQMKMCQSLSTLDRQPNGVDVQGRLNMLQTLQQTGNRECSQIVSHIQNRLDEGTQKLQHIKIGQTVGTDWNPCIGCLPEHRCVEKMDVILSKMQKINTSFRDDRSKRNLNNNDEQIHKFDKNRLKELCVTAQTLLEDHCIKKSHQLFNAYKKFYSQAVQIHDAGVKLEVLVSDVSKQQRRLVEKLKASNKQCLSQTESCLQAFGQPMSEVTSNGDSNSPLSQFSRQDRLDTMRDSLQSTTSSLQEVKDLLDENTSMLERITSLQEPLDEEGDKSWEYVH